MLERAPNACNVASSWTPDSRTNRLNTQICAFIFFVFGILGVQLFAGALRLRCYDLDSGLGGEDMCGGMASCE